MKHQFGWLKMLALSSALAVPALALSAVDANLPKSYALRLPVVPVADAALQRLILPAQALVSLQTSNYSDLRIFNAQGQSLPMALTTGAAQVQTAARQVTLVAYPIVGSADSASLDGLSLRIEEQQGKRVVQINTGNNTNIRSAAEQQKVLGTLLDARTLDMPVTSITLDVDLPVNQPLNFMVHASKDLKNWTLLTEAVLYRGESTNGLARQQLGDSTLVLPIVDLAGNYLRVTWANPASQTGTVTLRGATLTAAQSVQRQRVNASMATPVLSNPHSLGFTLPFATPLAALKIIPKGDNVLIPVRVLGRNHPSQPWSLIVASVIYKLSSAGKVQLSGPLELPANSYREIQIEADKAGPGFAAAPEITLQFEPAQIVFLASGAPPYTLAAGLSQAAGAYLPIASLMPGYRTAQEDALPLAQVDAVAPVVLTNISSDALPLRSLILWGVLLLGVLALSGMAWVLLKKTQKPLV